MSYDIELVDASTGVCIELDEPHHMIGGTMQLGGCPTAELNITYNYAKHFCRVLDEEKGIRVLYGKTAAETIPILERAIKQLGDDVDDDYWRATEGNAKLALQQCLELARMKPNGVWKGD